MSNTLHEEAVMRFRNHYHCKKCREKWTSDWDSTCDDECPSCGTVYTPVRSQDLCLTCGKVTRNGKDNCSACIKKGAFDGLTEP
jgi:hypothetical protein